MRDIKRFNRERSQPALADHASDGRRHRRIRRWGLAALCMSVASAVGACGPASAPPAGPTTAGSPPAATTPPPVLHSAPLTVPPTPASAAQEMARFFTQAQEMDSDLRRVATRINAGFVGNTIRIDQATISAIRDVRPQTVAQTIPGGLDPDLRRLVLQVYTDLVSRRAAMNRIIEYGSDGPLQRDSAEGREILACLANGHPAAARFNQHLAAAQTAASKAAPVVAAPSSREAAEVAILATYIHLANNGCGDCGGNVRPDLPALTWSAGNAQQGQHLAGTVGGIQFDARFHAARGWTINLNAC
jgi:hypothetical protein